MDYKSGNKMQLWEKVSYGFGNLGLCLCTTVVTAFIMFFYTDIVKLSLAQVGTIMLIGGISDAVSDPLMGIWIDKTTTKWGKSRPFLLIFAVPLALSCFLVFRVPNASEGVRYLYALITYVFYNLAYTAICIPQNTLLTSITDDQKERLGTNMFGTLGTNIGQFAVNGFALTLVAVLGRGADAEGYARIGIVFGVLGALFILACFKNTRERVNPPAEQKITVKDTLKSFRNLPWILCSIAMMLLVGAVVVRSTQTVYFTQYVLNDPSKTGQLLSIMNIIGIPLTFLTPYLASKFGKRNMVVSGGIFGVIGCVGLFLFKSNYILVMASSVVISIGISLAQGVGYVMVAESIDYGEWKQGIRVQGALMAFVGFGVKVVNSVFTMICSKILDAGGYDAEAATQSASAIRAIEVNYIGLPFLMFIIITIAALCYTLDKKYPGIKTELDARRMSVKTRGEQAI